MSDKKVSNVSIRAPEHIRTALEMRRSASARRSLTHVVEDTIIARQATIERLTVRRAPSGTPRLTLSINADLVDSLKSVADDRCISVGDLLYSLLSQDLADEIHKLTGRRRTEGHMAGLATAA